MAVPVPLDPGAGIVLTSTMTHSWYQTQAWLLAPPKCRLTTTATTTTGTAFTWSSVAFNAEMYDPTGMHDNATNNSRITIATTGYYRLAGRSRTAANTGLGVQFAVSGTAVADTDNWAAYVTGPGVADASTTATLYLTAGQYVELQVVASSATVVVTVSTFEAHWVSN